MTELFGAIIGIAAVNLLPGGRVFSQTEQMLVIIVIVLLQIYRAVLYSIRDK